MRLSIKPLRNSDTKRIIDIILPIEQLEFGVPITIEDQPDLEDIETHYITQGGNFWGAVVDDELCGTIGLLRFGENQAAVRKMFVRKEFRGKEFGLAVALLKQLITYSREGGISEIYLGTVDILKAAIRFYEKNGFVEVDKNELPVDFPLMKLDNIYFKLDLGNENH